MAIRLIVGLGNPGPEYEQTRHNAGFWLVDNLANGAARCTLARETRFQALVGKSSIGAQEIWLLEPQTFMNRSGQSVGALARFYKINPDEIVALGASILAADKDPDSDRVAETSMVDVTGHTLSVAVFDTSLNREILHPIIPKETSTPCAGAKHSFTA